MKNNQYGSYQNFLAIAGQRKKLFEARELAKAKLRAQAQIVLNKAIFYYIAPVYDFIGYSVDQFILRYYDTATFNEKSMRDMLLKINNKVTDAHSIIHKMAKDNSKEYYDCIRKYYIMYIRLRFNKMARSIAEELHRRGNRKYRMAAHAITLQAFMEYVCAKNDDILSNMNKSMGTAFENRMLTDGIERKAMTHIVSNIGIVGVDDSLLRFVEKVFEPIAKELEYSELLSWVFDHVEKKYPADVKNARESFLSISTKYI